MYQDDEQKECESKIWWGDIRKLANGLELSLNKRGNKNLIFVQLNETKFGINGSESKWLLILLNNIKLNLENMKVSFISSDPSNVINILSLAQIVYYIEKAYV